MRKNVPTLTLVSIMTGLITAGAAIAGDISLQPISTFETGWFAQEAASQLAHDPLTDRIYVTNVRDDAIDVIDISDPTDPVQVGVLGTSGYGSKPTSIAVRDGLIAVSVEAFVAADPGKVVFFDATMNYLTDIAVGAYPDMLGFSPDGAWLLVANEGEQDYLTGIDSEGSISVIDMTVPVAALSAATADFSAFGMAAVESEGIRIIRPGSTVAQDLEPEYITFSDDSGTAWVTLQENNAIAVVDVTSATVTSLHGLGVKDHSQPGVGLDASDEDGGINITQWPVFGMYQPDEIAAYQHQGQTYLVLANEGDAHEYEKSRVKHSNIVLDPVAFPNAAYLKQDANLGRLRVSNRSGDTDGDGDYDELYAFGARSFSIRAADGTLIYDSADDFEQTVATLLPAEFNTNHDENQLDSRSDNKGPEPEGLTLGAVGDQTYAFIGLERIGGLMVYNVTDPYDAQFVEYVNSRNFAENPGTGSGGDLGPEGMIFIDAGDSPTGKPLVAVSYEISGTTTLWEVGDADSDGDGMPNAEDCAPLDDQIWSAPGAVEGLLLHHVGGVTGTTTVEWFPPVDSGGTALFYDLLTSGDPSEFNSATCLESEGTDTVATDASTPATDSLRAYLVRAGNACGEGPLGLNSMDEPRVGSPCP